jgi:hypothetical protein
MKRYPKVIRKNLSQVSMKKLETPETVKLFLTSYGDRITVWSGSSIIEEEKHSGHQRTPKGRSAFYRSYSQLRTSEGQS